MPRCLFLLLASFVAIGTLRPAAQTNALFTFHSDPWLNLHHFARVSARSPRSLATALLSTDRRSAHISPFDCHGEDGSVVALICAPTVEIDSPGCRDMLDRDREKAPGDKTTERLRRAAV